MRVRRTVTPISSLPIWSVEGLTATEPETSASIATTTSGASPRSVTMRMIPRAWPKLSPA